MSKRMNKVMIMAKSETVALQQKQIANLIDAINLVARAEKTVKIVNTVKLFKTVKMFKTVQNFETSPNLQTSPNCSRQVQNFILRINLSRNE